MKRFPPEVIQSSEMDCGPAALTSLLCGFGIDASYGRLREACQTDVDGTSIDTLEEIAKQLGLDAEQVLVPFENLVHDPELLPAIAVVQLTTGMTHFIVLWRRAGDRVLVMDPAAGHRWLTIAQLREDVYRHTMTLDQESWQAWAQSDVATVVLARRAQAVGADGRALVDAAVADVVERGLAKLDAALRLVEELASVGAIRGAERARLLDALCAAPSQIPASAWSVVPDTTDPARVHVTGIVLISVRGRRAKTAEDPPLSGDLAAALAESPPRPARLLWGLLRRDGLLGPAVLVAALATATAMGLLEALLFRGLLDVGRQLAVTAQRLGAIAALGLLLALLALLEIPLLGGALQLGRRLEARLRVAFLTKLPRLGDRYIHSRPRSDMADRNHALHGVRELPHLAAEMLRSLFELLVTTIGLAWIDPRSAPLAIVAAAIVVAVPLFSQRPLIERDLRQRSQLGALSRFYLDALLGLVAVRTHGAERAIRREHESLLVSWMTAGRALLRTIRNAEALQLVLGFALAALLLHGHLARHGESASVLLFAYWALSLPASGERLALALRQVPAARNVVVRVTEPLGAREAPSAAAADDARPTSAVTSGAALDFADVTVVGGGHVILEGVSLHITSGEHVAVVGASGAGKSSLVGLLLGWHTPARGELRIDGAVSDPAVLARLRRETAWADPEVQLWNRSLLDNLRYGATDETAVDVAALVEAAGLRRVIETLPEGQQTRLGEGGGLVSGGEGQRVRFARALQRSAARLVILDEAFRGHDRETRQSLLAHARAHFAAATLVCVTHDVAEARRFSRVLVVDGGRVIEDGDPATLDREGTRFRALLDAEQRVTQEWTAAYWRRLTLRDGHVEEAS